MGKFKVGDKVRFTDACDTRWWFGPHKECKEGVISDVLQGRRGYEYEVRSGEYSGRGFVRGEHIELIAPTFKVGDRVVPSGKACVDLVKHWNEYWSEEGAYEGAFYVTAVNASGDISYSNKPGGPGPHVEGYCMTPAPLKLEAGKYYRTRNGKRVGPLMTDQHAYLFGAQGYSLTSEWYSDGRRNSGWETDLDIVAEWMEETVASAFKVGDFLTKSCWPEDGFEVTKIEGGKVYLSDGFPSPYSYPYDIDEDWIIVAKTATAPTTNCIVALIENGQPKPSERPHVHPSRNKAETEAGRLARKHKGREFGVYELVVTKQEKPEHEWQRLALEGRTIDAIKKLRDISGMSLRAAKAAVDDCRAA